MGGCTLSNVRRGVTQSAGLGYWIGARFARHGYMFAAVRAILPFVFTTLGLHRLEAACIPENEPRAGCCSSWASRKKAGAALSPDQR